MSAGWLGSKSPRMLPAGKRAADAGVRGEAGPADSRGPSWRGALPLGSGSETMSAVLVPMIRTFDAAEFDAAELARRKDGQRISLCLPARDEASTVGSIVDVVRRELVERVPLVDELLVIDDHSTDRTAAVARAAGAQVISAADVLPRYGGGHGKGEALWKSLFASDGDIVVWCDADVRDFDPAYVVGLAGPLLSRPELGFVKGFYDRPLRDGQDGGGRVTELVARPALALLVPPTRLGGATARRRVRRPARAARAAAVRLWLRGRHRLADRRGRALRARRGRPGRSGHPPASQPQPQRARPPGHRGAPGRPEPGRAGPDRRDRHPAPPGRGGRSRSTAPSDPRWSRCRSTAELVLPN